MRSILASLLVLLSVSCGSPDSSLKLENTPPPAFNDRTLDRVTFLTAHNAFANDIKSLAPNQEWDITKQMEEGGVRGFMLDIYSDGKKAVLCHPKCKILFVDLSRPLVDELRRFEAFMKKDRNAIITLHLEWTTGPDGARADQFEAAFNQVPDLKNMIFDPYKADVKKNGWPKVRDMIAQNKRLLILSQSDSTRSMGVAYDREFTVENYWSMGATASDRSCRSRWDDIPLDRDNTQANKFRRLFVMNHFRDVPTIVTAALDNTHGSLWGRVTNECLAAARRIPNYVAVDFANKGTGPETVAALNRAIGIAFQHGNWQGQPELLMPGKENLEGGNGKLGNDSLSSMEIFFKGTRVALYDDRDQKKFLLDVIETTGSFGNDVNDKVSSWRVDN